MGYYCEGAYSSGPYRSAVSSSPVDSGAAVVSDAGTSSANGLYQVDGTFRGKNNYVNGSNSIYWDGAAWVLFDDINVGDIAYVGEGDSDYPWEAVWSTSHGDDPAPSVTRFGGGGGGD